jgi:RNA polymerase sigma-70 factor (ECF subfamily)
MPEGDQQWVERARTGDKAAFEEIYRRHLGRVYALCLRLTADAALAEELTQETFVHTWQKLGSFRGESAFTSWLHRLTVNRVLEHQRSRRRYRARVVPAEDQQGLEPRARQGQPEAGIDLERALELLPEGARTVFVLHDVEGYLHTEIADLLDVSEGTTKKQLHRARMLLREALAK